MRIGGTYTKTFIVLVGPLHQQSLLGCTQARGSHSERAGRILWCMRCSAHRNGRNDRLQEGAGTKALVGCRLRKDTHDLQLSGSRRFRVLRLCGDIRARLRRHSRAAADSMDSRQPWRRPSCGHADQPRQHRRCHASSCGRPRSGCDAPTTTSGGHAILPTGNS